MAWTATIVEKYDVEGVRSAGIQFTNGTMSFRKNYPLYGVGLAQRVTEDLNRLNQQDLELSSLVVGQEVAPYVPVTPAKTASEQWLGDYSKLEKVQKLIDLGVLTGNETPVVTLRGRVNGNFKPEYLDLL